MSTATTAPTTVRSRGILEQYKAILQQILVVVVLILLSVFFTIMKPAFADWSNLSSLLLASVVTGVQALGLSFVIAAGGIGPTPGPSMAVTSVFAGVLIAKSGGSGLPMWIGVLDGLAAGALLGLTNGVLVVYTKMQLVIVMLAMMMVRWGAALVTAGGKNISPHNVEGYSGITVGEIVPGAYSSILVLILLAVIAGVFMNHTVVGHYPLSIGSNEEATHISGVDTYRWKVLAYVICGLFMGISGILMSSWLSVAQPILGQGYEMYTIAAAVIGSISLRGGRASIFGAVIGAVTIQTIFNGLTIMGVQDQWQKMVLRVVVLIAVVVDIVRRDGKKEWSSRPIPKRTVQHNS